MDTVRFRITSTKIFPGKELSAQFLTSRCRSILKLIPTYLRMLTSPFCRGSLPLLKMERYGSPPKQWETGHFPLLQSTLRWWLTEKIFSPQCTMLTTRSEHRITTTELSLRDHPKPQT